MAETGSYLTVDELIARQDEKDLLALCGTGGWNGAAGRQIDQARLGWQLKRAQSMIAGYVKSRYPALEAMVSGDMPEALKGAAETLVIYWLRDRVHDTSGVSDEWRDRYRDVISWLKDIHAGRADLDLPGVDEASAEDGSGILSAFPVGRADHVLKGYGFD
ncbi:phage protein Gp36 family protein [uncultured Cohaesibacter sp.]|uniref:phage protein Gp36 family protein n=1 Tax=uncultured Cohaesibacter sp. TaxID=1002546 RepID=UPI0029C743E8|nr:phage protein Gp36 family protein [uncultured Cohaesibacter sp.]